jgi:hypothetical protein
MEIALWAGLAVGVVLLIVVAAIYLPARTIIIIDTQTSTARAEQRVLGGLGPMVYKRMLPANDVGTPIPVFQDPERIGPALMTPGIADMTYEAIRRLFALNPKVAAFSLHFNLGDPAQQRVVDTAAHASLAVAPAAIRERVIVARSELPGAEISARFELDASVAQINSIYNDLLNSRAGREFRKRLKRKPKPAKRPVREVRAS